MLLTTLILSIIGAQLTHADVGVDPCDKMKPALRTEAALLIAKYRANAKKQDQDRSILLLVPRATPEITPIELPAGGSGTGAYIPKVDLDAVKKAAGIKQKVIIWNNTGSAVDLLPYENAQQMSTAFNPSKDCSPSSQTSRRIGESCSVVDLSSFNSGATVLYDESAKGCEVIRKYSQKSNLSSAEEVEYIQTKKQLALSFRTRTGEKRDLAIDKESTIVLPKKDPNLEIGESSPRKRAQPRRTISSPGK